MSRAPLWVSTSARNANRMHRLPTLLSGIFLVFLTSWVGDPSPERGGRAKRFFKLTDRGRTLLDDYTVTVIGTITPFYCSVEQVRLAGGIYLNKVSDTTIAAMIYGPGNMPAFATVGRSGGRR